MESRNLSQSSGAFSSTWGPDGANSVGSIYVTTRWSLETSPSRQGRFTGDRMVQMG